jgi:uncharacterized protein Yka (UPF0111/DUF47 family)
VSLRRLFRDLAGRGDDRLVESLAEQIDAVVRAPQLLLGALDAGDVGKLSGELEDIEHAGDERRRALIAELSRSLTTPIDREDLFRVSRSIDDVLDNLRDFAREYDLYGPESGARCVPLLQSLIDGLACLREGVCALTAAPDEVGPLAHETKSYGNAMRRGYEDALSELFDGELTMDVLKERELLRRLDVVALRLGEAADALADGRMKRS